MDIIYTKNYDELIKQKYKEIKELEKLKNEETKQYYTDNKISCKTCRYSWLNDLSIDNHTCCEKGNCKLCHDVCNLWQEQNEVSKMLAEKFPYADDLAYNYKEMFNSSIVDGSLEKVEKFIDMYYSK